MSTNSAASSKSPSAIGTNSIMPRRLTESEKAMMLQVIRDLDAAVIHNVMASLRPLRPTPRHLRSMAQRAINNLNNGIGNEGTAQPFLKAELT